MSNLVFRAVQFALVHETALGVTARLPYGNMSGTI
jgi:hypothetical protein